MLRLHCLRSFASAFPFAAAAFIGLASCARSQPATDAPVIVQAAVEPSASRSEAVSGAIHASDLRTLNAKIGQEVVVHGDVARAAKSGSGLHFLNFENSSLSVVCFAEHAKKFPNRSPSETYRDRAIEVRGTLERYKGKLQIKLIDPKQIRILEEGSSPADPPEGVELKPIGRDAWLSPAGLRYEGRDPAGLTRVEHIERHTRDQPDREGPHGVFDGGSAVAFAVIDEAWTKAKKTQLTPRVEGDRSTYLVSLGRRVGYLGGSLGRERGHPALSRVLIVFETGTPKIITAYPR
ncbi:MAG: OB-fold nucleic acid binding domain-containing protein [Planctomycetales bacterium]|nr:OB-fold nucleic acid binding domain-containing protein [Planctomycetales bacterium]